METKDVKITTKKCPICFRPTLYATNVAEDKEMKKTAVWYRCVCGVLFQEEPPEKVLKDKKYIEAHNKIKKHDEIVIHAPRTYAPVIEELTYGRKMLEIGFCTEDVNKFFSDRGWLWFGIDSNKDIKETDRIIKADFETTDQLYTNSYDAIWMSFVLEQFHNPMKALKKCWDILQDYGVIYISTPDIDFLNVEPYSWPHFRKDEHYVMWSSRALCRELERLGFEIILKRRNFVQRFGYYHDIQIIAQKPYF